MNVKTGGIYILCRILLPWVEEEGCWEIKKCWKIKDERKKRGFSQKKTNAKYFFWIPKFVVFQNLLKNDTTFFTVGMLYTCKT